MLQVGVYDKQLGDTRFTDAIMSYNRQGSAVTKPASECPQSPCSQCAQSPAGGTGGTGGAGAGNTGSGPNKC